MMVPQSEDDPTRRLGPDDATVLQTRTEPAVAPTVTMSTVRLPMAGSNRLPVSTRLAEFEITGVIGEGGFGIVYTAQDHSLEREVAIKEYMPSGLAARVDGLTVGVLGEDSLETFHSGLNSFVNEARLLARFDHPSLLKVYRFWEANGTAYMAMPHYKGETLKQRLRRSGAPDEAWLRAMLLQLLAALDVIHAENCFHRDIAPDNIFLVENDRPVLLDFGAARRVISDKTHALTVILKPGFAPVEQYADVPNLKQGAWTDLYALAAVVYHAITGEKPPPAISRYVSDQMVPLSQRAQGRYSATFLAAIDQALSVQPSARPQNADQMRALLAAEASTAPPVAPAPVASGPAPAVAGDDKTVTLKPPAVVMPPTPAPAPASTPVPVPVAPPNAAPSAAVVADRRPHAPGVAASKGEPARGKGGNPLLWLGVAAIMVAGVAAVLFGGRLLGPPATVTPPPLSQPATLHPTPPVAATPPAQTPASTPPTPVPVPEPAPAQGKGPAGQAPMPAAQPPVAATPPVRKTPAARPPASVASAPPTTAQRVGQLLAGANASLDRKDYGQARKLADEALALDPANADAEALKKKVQQAAWSEVQIQ